MRALMWTLTVVLMAALLLAALPAVAQEDAPADVTGEVPDEVAERIELLKQMGMDDEAALLFSMMTGGDMDPAQMMLLMMMMDQGGRGGGEAFGILMLMNALGGKQEAPQPVVLDRGDTLVVVDGGVLYVLDLQTMELAGSLAYAAGAKPNPNEALRMLAPIIGRAKQKAEQTSCLSNLRQLCTAFMMYAADFDGALPTANWVQDIQPYHNNAALLRCPSRPELPVAYAINEKLLGALQGDLANPAQTIVLFESNLGGASPVGFPVDVPEQGVHNGGINCGFADGHVKWLRADTARQMLEQTLFAE